MPILPTRIPTTWASPTSSSHSYVSPFADRNRIKEASIKKLIWSYYSDTHEKPYKCITCGASFGRRDLLKRHQNIGHSPVTPAAQRPSPVIGHPGGDSAFHEQLNSAALDHNPRDSSWGADSLQRSSIVPAQHEQPGEVYSGGCKYPAIRFLGLWFKWLTSFTF